MARVDALVVGGSVAAYASVLALLRSRKVAKIARVGPVPPDELTVLLWRRGTKALERLGMKRADAENVGTEARVLRYRDAGGEVLSQIELQGQGVRFVSKAMLTDGLGALARAFADIPVDTTELIDAIRRDSRAFEVSVHGTKSGLTTRALIGAGGWRDPVRETAFGADLFVENGAIVVGSAPMPSMDGWCGDGIAELVFAPDAFLGVLPRFDAKGARVGVVWWLSLPSPLTGVPESALLEHAVARVTRSFCPSIARIVATSFNLRQLEGKRWVHPATAAGAHRIALVGDSFRAGTPELGLGVTWALEDAVRLGERVGDRGLVAGIDEYVQTTVTTGESVLGRAFGRCIVRDQEYELRRRLLSASFVPGLAAQVLNAQS